MCNCLLPLVLFNWFCHRSLGKYCFKIDFDFFKISFLKFKNPRMSSLGSCFYQCCCIYSKNGIDCTLNNKQQPNVLVSTFVCMHTRLIARIRDISISVRDIQHLYIRLDIQWFMFQLDWIATLVFTRASTQKHFEVHWYCFEYFLKKPKLNRFLMESFLSCSGFCVATPSIQVTTSTTFLKIPCRYLHTQDDAT